MSTTLTRDERRLLLAAPPEGKPGLWLMSEREHHLAISLEQRGLARLDPSRYGIGRLKRTALGEERLRAERKVSVGRRHQRRKPNDKGRRHHR